MEIADDQQALRCLRLAQRTADIELKQQVALYVFNKYHWRVRRLFCQDPATDREDLEQIYFMGIMEAIDSDRGKGDSLYFLSQHGAWRVGSVVTSSRILRAGSERASEREAVQDADDHPLSPNSTDHAELVIKRLAAEQMVVEIRQKLDGQAAKTFDLLLSGEAGEPGEPGTIKAVAEKLDVTPQRVCQIVNSINRKATKEEGQ